MCFPRNDICILGDTHDMKLLVRMEFKYIFEAIASFEYRVTINSLTSIIRLAY